MSTKWRIAGAVYYNKDGAAEDPFRLFAQAGTDIIRVRLWHNPDWTDYSNFEDVKKTISRAKAEGMQVLLDFHNSDDWADPAKQIVPEAWKPVVDNQELLGDSLYNYIYSTLKRLNDDRLLPDFVQMGNEINSEILQSPDQDYPQINWTRNAHLINRGLQAIRQVSTDFEQDIQAMLHIAQPENARWWFEEATENGVTDYDWIGLSYYPSWSEYGLTELPAFLESLKLDFDKKIMVVETAYPFTMSNNDAANNILGTEALISGYPASPQGQLNYLIGLEKSLKAAGAEGLIYWEPAWVSTSCATQWGQGSHWDNATLFGNSNKALPGMEYFSR